VYSLPSELIMPFAGVPRLYRRNEIGLGGDGGRDRLQSGLAGGYEIGCYGGRPLVVRYGRWILMGPPRTRLGRPILSALGRYGGFHCALLPVIRTFIALPAGIGPHAARQVSHLYVPRLVPGVSCWRTSAMKMGENWRRRGSTSTSSMAVIGALLWPGWSGSVVALARTGWVSRINGKSVYTGVLGGNACNGGVFPAVKTMRYCSASLKIGAMQLWFARGSEARHSREQLVITVVLGILGDDPPPPGQACRARAGMARAFTSIPTQLRGATGIERESWVEYRRRERRFCTGQ